jgi:hypothetical protein
VFLVCVDRELTPGGIEARVSSSLTRRRYERGSCSAASSLARGTAPRSAPAASVPRSRPSGFRSSRAQTRVSAHHVRADSAGDPIDAAGRGKRGDLPDCQRDPEQKAGELDLTGERTPYLCECEEERCTNVISLSREEYESVRAHPRRFVMVAGHESERDQVVQEGAGFTVIEKVGEEGELVAQRDPRADG